MKIKQFRAGNSQLTLELIARGAMSREIIKQEYYISFWKIEGYGDYQQSS